MRTRVTQKYKFLTKDPDALMVLGLPGVPYLMSSLALTPVTLTTNSSQAPGLLPDVVVALSLQAGRNYIHPPPPPILAKRHSPGEGGGGVYFEVHAAGILYPPPIYTPPTPRRVFSGVGGVGVYKIWPRSGGSPP